MKGGREWEQQENDKEVGNGRESKTEKDDYLTSSFHLHVHCISFSSSLFPSLLPPFPSMEVPVLWVRVDPEFQWLRHMVVEQPDTVWHNLLKYERDVVAQVEGS